MDSGIRDVSITALPTPFLNHRSTSTTLAPWQPTANGRWGTVYLFSGPMSVSAAPAIRRADHGLIVFVQSNDVPSFNEGLHAVCLVDLHKAKGYLLSTAEEMDWDFRTQGKFIGSTY